MAHDKPSSGDSESVRIAAPAEALLADAAGPAQLLKEHEISAEGGRAASNLGQFSWALFEGARDPNILFQIYIISPFFATVMMRDPIRGQELWGDTTTWAGIITAVLAPFFGAVADKGGPRKPWLFLFSALMVISFAGTWLGVADSSARIIFIVAALVVLNNVVFEFSNVFHGAMLPSVAPSSRMGGLSGLAFALGNGASLILLVFFLFAFMLPGQVDFLPKHPPFGVDQAAHVPERLSGPITAVWMMLAAIPLFLFTPDKVGSGLPMRRAVVEGIGSVIRTVKSLKHYRNVAHYIGARSLFNDGMTGVLTFSGIYAAGTFGLGALQMTMYGIELCVFATLGGFFGGWLDNKLGSRKALLISIGGTALSFGLALTITPDHLFWFFPVSTAQVLPLPVFNTWSQIVYTGLVDVTALCIVGGYANNRTMMARIAPVEKMTEFFGLMSLSGTATTFFAPLLVSWMTWWTHSQRGGMVGVVVLLVAGWLWMFWVKEERATAV
jgi:UMF1 family MFS transporter